MTPNILICQSEAEVEAHFRHDFIAHIDGKSTSTLRQFYEQMAELLEIPAFGFTLDDLNEALNDLQWLEDERIVLYFTCTTNLIDKERDPAKIGSLLSLLDATAEDWKWVDEHEEIDTKELIVVVEDSPRIRQLLDKEAIKYAQLSSLS